MLRLVFTIVATAVVISLVSATIAVTARASPNHQKRDKRVYTHDFLTSTVIVGKYYGRNVREWLKNCSSSEGGHGGFVWRSHIPPVRYSSGQWEDKPGGWMQFFKSTFDSNAGWAFIDAKHKGLKIHPKAKSYYEPLGQAIVAGAMYYYHGNPGTWTGVTC